MMAPGKSEGRKAPPSRQTLRHPRRAGAGAGAGAGATTTLPWRHPHLDGRILEALGDCLSAAFRKKTKPPAEIR